MPSWRSTLHMAILPHRASRRWEKSIWESVGIGLYKHGDIGVFKGLGGTVFIAEIGQTHDDALIFSAIFLKKIGIELALGYGFDGAEACEAFLHGDAIKAGVGDGLFHFGTGGNGFARKKAAVCKIKRKSDFHSVPFLAVRQRIKKCILPCKSAHSSATLSLM